MNNIILKMDSIVKEFSGVRALDNVNLEVEANTIHAICGENGAGKSTLMNVLSGVYPHGTYSGTITYKDKECTFKEIRDSEKEGIVIIHQELMLIPYLSIMENIFLGNEITNKTGIDWQKTRYKALELMEIVGLHERPETLIKDISVGKQQLVEIAKALSKDVKLLILDEPTAALNDIESDKLLNFLLSLKHDRGVTAIMISHKLNEITKVADHITVIRDGKSIQTLDKSVDEINEDVIIKGMVGRDITHRFPPREARDLGQIGFEVKNLCVKSESNKDKLAVNDVSFNVKKGEVVGIAGLMGAGRTELAMSIFGRSYGTYLSGDIIKDGKKIEVKNTHAAINNKIAYVTEDRKGRGLILFESIRVNTTLPSLAKISAKGVINLSKELHVSNEYFKKLHIIARNIHQKAGSLSGGNQQKIMLARWIYADPDVIIFDEPTRGIDVGAKYEIYCIINELAALGKCVIVISSELPEVLGVSDRVYVMNEGKFVGELNKEEASQEAVMKCIMQSLN